MKKSYLNRKKSVKKPFSKAIKRKVKTPRQKLKDKLEKLVKEKVKQRDNSTCQKCDKVVEGANCHVSHVIPRSRSLRLMFDLVNLKVLCYYHHIRWWHLNPLEASAWFKDKFPKRWEYLQEALLNDKPVKDYELEEKLEELKNTEAL